MNWYKILDSAHEIIPDYQGKESIGVSGQTVKHDEV